MMSLMPFPSKVWGECNYRGATAVSGPLPHNNMCQHPTKCAWCDAAYKESK